MVKMRTLEEAIAEIRANAPNKATFNVHGYDVELDKDKCQGYKDACQHFTEVAPLELLDKMNQMSDEDYIETLGSLMGKIHAKFGIEFDK